MKLGFGMQIWLRDGHFENFHRMLDEAATIGLDGLECCWPFLYQSYASKPGQLKALLDLHGLALSSYYIAVPMGGKKTNDESTELVKRYAAFIREAGGSDILFDEFYHGRKEWPEDRGGFAGMMAENVNRFAQIARAEGVYASWHQHWGSVLQWEEPFSRFMAETDPQYVSLCLDVGQAALCGWDVTASVQKYVGRINRYVHYKDILLGDRKEGALWPGKTAPSDSGAYDVDSYGRWVELGRGVVDFPAIHSILLEAGFDGWIVDDLDYTAYGAAQCAQACLDYLHHRLRAYGQRPPRDR
ncbi:MAG: sugar phosphate isomerase/epimerase [Clostridiales bacterium]|jgi:inosose dehydratase|nr:sugar phosphate isomerase/epimerase [Clostridiales bacterium]